MIKLFEPHISNDEIYAATSILKSKFWASGGGVQKVSEFEEKFQKFVCTKKCVAVSNGSAALTLALSMFNIKNKEVLVPSLTFVSTVHAIIENGGKPIFVDVDPSDLCMSINDLNDKISKKSSMILPVHFGGIPCDLDKIKKIAKNYSLSVVEDAAHACGASFNSKKIGSHSDAVCFSFHPVKNLAMPSGGAICINTKNPTNFVNDLKSKRWCGIKNRKGYDYDVSKLGWNYYMNEISAAIGIAQLKKLPKLNNFRKKIAKAYHDELKVSEKMPFQKNSSYHLYWISVKNRDDFMKKMKKSGIETGIHYNPVHKMTMYKKFKAVLPITEKISKNIVSLPIHPNLTDKEIYFIIDTVNKNLN
jgi:dTDP-4-amino-4,6-dideoxygalactose transaminase|tara:strand:+ start:648 stop:1730 length:1083 start_codon:yes stop_codon:yes gene_type:complete